MFNYELVVKDDKGNRVTSYSLEVGASKKGTYATLSGKAGNHVLPFGKLYIDEATLDRGLKAAVKAGNGAKKAQSKG